MVLHFSVSSVPTPDRSWLRAGFTNLTGFCCFLLLCGQQPDTVVGS